MPRAPGSKKLTPEKKVAVALFLVDLAARGTRVVDAVTKATATFQLGSTVVWEIWRSRMDAGALVAERPRKPKKTKRTKDEIARLIFKDRFASMSSRSKDTVAQRLQSSKSYEF
ncbi:hypothetical protein PC121_g14352 [Phytophthora cactorum]|nr:hypothetical protein PC121_g14352 [Phytophthora cactorum]